MTISGIYFKLVSLSDFVILEKNGEEWVKVAAGRLVGDCHSRSRMVTLTREMAKETAKSEMVPHGL